MQRRSFLATPLAAFQLAAVALAHATPRMLVTHLSSEERQPADAWREPASVSLRAGSLLVIEIANRKEGES